MQYRLQIPTLFCQMPHAKMLQLTLLLHVA